MVTSQGIAKGKTAYAPADIQVQDPSSFASKLGHIIGLRNKLKIAGGTLYGRFLIRSPGTFALAVLLPSEGRLPGTEDNTKPAPKKTAACLSRRPSLPKTAGQVPPSVCPKNGKTTPVFARPSRKSWFWPH